MKHIPVLKYPDLQYAKNDNERKAVELYKSGASLMTVMQETGVLILPKSAVSAYEQLEFRARQKELAERPK